jgi:hypothetical protein
LAIVNEFSRSEHPNSAVHTDLIAGMLAGQCAIASDAEMAVGALAQAADIQPSSA